MSTELKNRTYQFGLRIVLHFKQDPPPPWCRKLADQLLRSATSVGSNYRAACRGRSKAEFVAKLGICEEEADECLYWTAILRDSEYFTPKIAAELMDEADQLLSIIIASIKTAKGH
ncbi:MAG: four helix bundle protein [Verrucomicrobia bacterium]|nr:four helix bundle protein [Verrucomicrobiota bacterium]MDA1007124.1 four helix bundle protein [Verrucomicrobiota bacterium]